MVWQIRDWKEQVYGVREKEILPDNWNELRAEAFIRDNFRCLRCDKKFSSARLTAHHMMPRAEGGANDVTNLATLCYPCHDYVEIHDLRTEADIIGSYDKPLVKRGRPQGSKSKEKDEPPPENEESFDRPSWHAFVYGGGKNPLKDMSR